MEREVSDREQTNNQMFESDKERRNYKNEQEC